MTTNVEGAVRWEGPVLTENVQTGDGRLVDPGAAWWGEDHPGRFGVLRWVEADNGWHDGAVAVGVITGIERRGDDIWATGWIYPAAGDGAGQRVIEGMRATPPLYGGVSIDGDDVAVTVVDATVTESELAEQQAEVEEAWDEIDALLEALPAAAGDGPPPDDAVVLFQHDSGEIVERATRLGLRSVTLVDVPAVRTGFITLTTSTGTGGDSETGEPDETDSDAEGEGEGETVSAAAGCGCENTCGSCGTNNPVLPPLPASVGAQFAPDETLFHNPALTAVTPITVTGDGNVFGHVATWGTCHQGIDCGGSCGTMRCQLAPRSARGYTDFHRYAHTSVGHRLPVVAGRITVGHGSYRDLCGCCPGMDDHACRHLSFAQTVTHHDQLTPVAYVTAGEDTHGIWVAGVLAPEADDDDVAVLSGRRKVSGDWRAQGETRELAEVLALSVAEPGFPVAQHAGGVPLSLLAAGRVTPDPVPAGLGGLSRADMADFARAVAEATIDGITEREARSVAAARLAAVPEGVVARERRLREKARARLTTTTTTR